MKFLNLLPILVLATALAACSGAPSDADVQTLANQANAQVEQQFAPLGLKMGDVFTSEVKVKNKAKQDDGRWLIEAESTVTAKKDLKELPQDAQIVVLAIFGDIKKGQLVGGAATSKFYMQKGDNGWIATR